MEEATKNQILNKYRGMGKIGNKDVLEKIPLGERRYKCGTCYTIVDETPCPVCGEKHIAVMCPLDHCGCSHDIVETIAYCPLCGDAICPKCGDHSVVQISRVTGYLSDVSGWGNGKRAELKDRTHYNVGV